MFAPAVSAQTGTTGSSENTGFYAGLSGGVTLLEDSDIDSSVLGAPATGEVEFDTGFSIGGQVGYKWPSSVRTEIEYRYSRAETDSATVSVAGLTASGAVDGAVWSHAFLANAWYDFDLNNGWMPYVGGGIGGFVVDAEDSEGDFVFGGQVGGGIQYAFSKDIVFDLGYRYVLTQDPKFESETAGIGDVDAEYASHNILFGVRGHF